MALLLHNYYPPLQTTDNDYPYPSDNLLLLEGGLSIYSEDWVRVIEEFKSEVLTLSSQIAKENK